MHIWEFMYALGWGMRVAGGRVDEVAYKILCACVHFSEDSSDLMDSSDYQKFLSRVKNVKKYMGLSSGWRGWDLHKGV